MLRRLLARRPSPALIVAFVALFVAGAGTAGAARLITGKQIKNGSITSSDIKNNSVSSTDVKNGSLLKKDFKSGQLPAGPAGPQGLQGPSGRAGRDGLGTLSYQTLFFSVSAGDTAGTAVTPCPADTPYPVGGDAVVFDENDNPIASDPLIDAEFVLGPTSTSVPDSWAANIADYPSGPDRTVEVDAICSNATSVPTTGPAKRKLGGLRRLRALKVR